MCRVKGEQAFGVKKCADPARLEERDCAFRLPDLDAESHLALKLATVCRWGRIPMTSIREGIDPQSLHQQTSIRGTALSEHRLEKIAAIETLIFTQDCQREEQRNEEARAKK